MKDEQPELFKEFAFAEYHEAANAYFNGVDIGYTTIKHYITINGLFVALLGALTETKSGVLSAANEMIGWLPWLALIISVSLFASLPHYFNHLENCRKRCQEIEHIYGGSLFTSLGKITRHKTAFNTGIGLCVIIGLIVAFWVILGVYMHSPGFGLGIHSA